MFGFSQQFKKVFLSPEEKPKHALTQKHKQQSFGFSNMHKETLLIILILLLGIKSKSQTLFSQNAEALGYNIALNGLIGGIGCLVNKPGKHKWPRTFLKGCLLGGGGGVVAYGGKRFYGAITGKTPMAFAWAGKITHALGCSMTENVAKGDKVFSHVYLDFGPARIDVVTAQPHKTKVRLLPFATRSAVVLLSNGYDLSLKKSLAYGALYFEHDGFVGSANYHGYAIANSIAINELNQFDKKLTIAHELVHTLQYREYLSFNTFLLKPRNKAIEKWKLLRQIDKYLYVDFPYYTLFYNIIGVKNTNCYYNNFFEFEAQLFSTRKLVPRC